MSDDDEHRSGEDAEEDEDGYIKDPRARIRALEDEKDRHARKAKRFEREIGQLQDRIAELEEGADDPKLADALRVSRLENAFLRHTIGRGDALDLEAAWDLANARGFFDTVEVTDDGDVAGMDDALTNLLGRYPWLADDSLDDESPDLPPKPRTGTHPASRVDNGLSKAQLQGRFPALRKRR